LTLVFVPWANSQAQENLMWEAMLVGTAKISKNSYYV